MLTKKNMVAIVLVILLIFAMPAILWAGEETPDFNLETILVTDTKIVGDGETTKVTSISVKDKIDAGQIKSITDLLQDVPGVVVQTSPQSGTTVTMRGMTNERILVAINGNVIENQGGLYRGRALEWDSLPVNNVKKIEIIRGASSALYGGTWGGVINIVTVENPGESKTFLKYSMGSYNDKKYSLSNQGTTENGNFSWIVNANKRERDGFYRNNFLDSKDISLNLTCNLAENKKLSLALTDSYRKEGTLVGNNQDPNNLNGWDSSYPETPVAPTTGGDPKTKYLDGSYREFKTNNFSVNYAEEDWKLGLYKNKQDRQDWLRLADKIEEPELKTDNSGYNWQQTKEFKDHKITYGFDYRKLKFDVLAPGNNNSLESKLDGYFLQDSWQVSKNTLIGLGLRYDQYQSKDLLADKEFNSKSQLSPKLNVTHQLSSKEAVYASASRVFRPPTVSDYVRWAFNYYDTSSAKNRNKYSQDKYGNPNAITLAQWQELLGQLEPEKGMAYELGWKKQFSDKLNGRITGFFNDIDNYVTTYMGSGINSGPPTYNIGNAKIKGVEVAADYQFSKEVGAVFNYTNQKATKSGDQLDPSGTEVTTIPKETINLGLRYDNQKGFRASLDGRYLSERKVDSKTTLGGYTLFDLALAYSKNDSTISLAVDNIFNKKYEETAGFPMPGTTYSLSYQIAF